jgi:hypothetical protein
MHVAMFSFFNKKPKQQELHEFSTNFGADMVRPFLERVQPLIESGFGAREIERVCQLVATLPVFMDDIASPDIYFFTSAALAQQIDAECERFTTERGM